MLTSRAAVPTAVAAATTAASATMVRTRSRGPVSAVSGPISCPMFESLVLSWSRGSWRLAHVPHAVVAADAGETPFRAGSPLDRRRDLGVALAARALGDRA